MMTRRHFIYAGLGATALAAFPARGGNKNTPFVFGARHNEKDTKFSIGAVDLKNQRTFEMEASFKGHGFAVHPFHSERVIMFGHVPSTVSCEFDLVKGNVVREFKSAEGRHFYGHGVFTPDGRHILATENDFKEGQGVIVLRDYESLKVVGEFPSFGIDPHEMDFCENGKTLIVANGGLKTRPDYGGGEIAEGPLLSSLAWIDFKEKKLLRKVELPNPSLSLRHLCRLPGDRYAVIIQEKGPDFGKGGLFVFVDGKGQWTLHGQDNVLREKLKRHTLSVAYLENQIAVTSPNGNRLSLWSTTNGKLIKTLDVPRVSGIVAIDNGKRALISTHNGKTYELKVRGNTLIESPFRWTNEDKWGAHLGSAVV